MSKILIFGGTGMLGHRLALTLSDLHEVAITSRKDDSDPIFSSLRSEKLKIFSQIKVENFNHVERVICKFNPDIVINCVGIIKQLDESKDPTTSLSINSLFPQKLAKLQLLARFRLILLSTDCVFNGEKGDYKEVDIPNAKDLYGMSKLLGEVSSQKDVLTIRTSIIGRELSGKKSLIEWFLQQKKINGYSKVIFSGLPTFTLSKIINDLIISKRDISGLYHISSQPISKSDLLAKINDYYDLGKVISPISDPRIDRSLNCNHFSKDTGYQAPSWDELISDLLIEDQIYSKD